MERTTFLKNYRIRLQYDGTPYEPANAGSTTTCEAVDERTGEPVSVTLIPVATIDAAERQAFEEHVSAAQKLRHANVAKVLDFGREGDDYVYVSERLSGEPLASWVRSHGPMPADAALRVGEQIVSVLSSAGFHKLPYPPIQSSDVVLVPGQTAEGTWPFVKVTNFGLPELKPRPEAQLIEPDVADKAAGEQAVNCQQFALPTTDIRSEIYSLGVTLYFLLTGVALSAEALQQGPKFSRFPKPLRVLLGQFLQRNPDHRPKDLLVVTEMIRQSLGKIERRRSLSDRYGIPLRTSVPQPRHRRPRLLVRTAAVVGVLLLLAAAVAPVIFPNSISGFIRRIQEPKQLGVLVGVPDSSQAAGQPHVLARAPQNTPGAPPFGVSPRSGNQLAAPEMPTPGSAAMSPNPFHVAPADVQQAQLASAQTQAVASSNSAANSSAASTPDSSVSNTAANPSAQVNTEQPTPSGGKADAQSTEKPVASKSKRTRTSRGSATYSQQGRIRSMRSHFMGITSDGRLIMRLPSGRTAIVAPDEEAVPRHRNRIYNDRDQMLGPPPGSGPDYYPGD